MMLDIFSRFMVGCVVYAHKSARLAKEFMVTVLGVYGTPDVVHANRGSSMSSKLVPALLPDLKVVKSHSRPETSNDNPSCAAAFKALQLPQAAWINQPTEPPQEDTQLAT